MTFCADGKPASVVACEPHAAISCPRTSTSAGHDFEEWWRFRVLLCEPRRHRVDPIAKFDVAFQLAAKHLALERLAAQKEIREQFDAHREECARHLRFAGESKRFIGLRGPLTRNHRE